MITIEKVAIKYKGKVYSLPKPNRHHNVIKLIYDETGKPIDGTDIQGFIDSENNFLNRKDALIVAKKTNQILDLNNIRANELFSEDLW